MFDYRLFISKFFVKAVCILLVSFSLIHFHKSSPTLLYGIYQRWARIRTGSDWIRTEVIFWPDQVWIGLQFFENWRIRAGSDWEIFCCFNAWTYQIL